MEPTMVLRLGITVKKMVVGRVLPMTVGRTLPMTVARKLVRTLEIVGVVATVVLGPVEVMSAKMMDLEEGGLAIKAKGRKKMTKRKTKTTMKTTMAMTI